MGYDRFECAPGLRLQAHERVSAIHHENLLQRLDRLEEMMERLELLTEKVVNRCHQHRSKDDNVYQHFW